MNLAGTSKNLDIAQGPVFILAGGTGTRLRSAYAEGPKVLAPVNGKPFLAYLLQQLYAAGFRDVVLCVGYKHQQIQDCIGDGSDVGLSITYSVEEDPLGTAGALRLAYELRSGAPCFFALNGDSFLQLDYMAMLQSHIASSAAATVALVCVDDTSRYGAVHTDERGRVSSFSEKSAASQIGLINAGAYIFTSEVLKQIPQGRPVSLEREVLPRLVALGLNGFTSGSYFIDIGVPEDFRRAQTEFRRLSWA